MLIKIQLKYAHMDFLLELFSDANSLEKRQHGIL